MVRDRLLSAAPVTGRATSGVPGLDGLIEGGFPANRTVLVCGGAGTGKTTLALQFLADGLAAGEPAILVSVDTKPRHVIEDAAGLDLGLDSALDTGALSLLDAAPYFTASRGKGWNKPGVDARQVAADLVQQVRKLGARRMAIDSITSLVPPDIDAGHAHDYLRSLVHALEDNLGCTILLTCRGRRRDPQATCGALRYLTSGIIELRLAQRNAQLERTLRLLKMRGTALDPADHRMSLDDRGIALTGLDTGAVSPFTTRLRPVPAAAPPPSDRPAAV